MFRPVVAVFAHKPDLTRYEEISLTQCGRVLGNHPLKLICPLGMNVSAHLKLAPQLEIDPVPPAFLSSLSAYNKFKISPWLYDRYQDYDFMLTYELDAFVFRDELQEWCGAGWDYIGAPWFKGDLQKPEAAIIRSGGNSGFSLRRIAPARRLNRRWKLIRPVHHVYRDWMRSTRGSQRQYRELIELAWGKNIFHHRFSKVEVNEDLFWSRDVARRFSEYRVAPYTQARRFSFEALPERLLAENAGLLPFGCHKWHTGLLNFWRPYLNECGYDV